MEGEMFQLLNGTLEPLTDDTAVSLNYLGRIQFLFTGRNYAEPQAKALRLQQRAELKQSPNPQDRRVLKERYHKEWKTLHNELVVKYRQARKDKKMQNN